MLLCIDEMHAMKSADLAVLLNALQNIADDTEGSPPLVVAAAGLPRVRSGATAAATFGERTAYEEVKALPEPDTRRALVETAAEAGVTMTPDAMDLLTQRSGGYPFFVQLLGWHAWQVADPAQAGDAITEEHARQAIEAAGPNIADLFEARFGAASPVESDFIVALARLAGDGTASRSDVAEAMGRTSRELSMVRRELLDKAVVADAGRGRLRFTLPGFAQFVLNETEG